MTEQHTALHALRAQFPLWGIVYDPFGARWVAVRGQIPEITAGTPQELAARMRQYDYPATGQYGTG